MAAFEYRQALEIRDACARHGVRYLFIGKSGAILLGYPDTTQDADLFLLKSPDNGRAAVAALRAWLRPRDRMRQSRLAQIR
jgi:hypothetical protein